MFFAAGRQTFLKNKNSSGLTFFMEPPGALTFVKRGKQPCVGESSSGMYSAGWRKISIRWSMVCKQRLLM